MKNRKKILLSSVVMLLVATMALTTTTYAWFTTGNTGTIDTFEFTAESASGIQFSLNAEKWQTTITSTNITSALAIATNTGSGGAQEGSQFTTSANFTPLSTTAGTIAKASGSEDGKLVLYKIESGADGALTTSANTTGYYVFNIYVNNLASVAKNLQLTGVTVSDVTSADPAIADKDTSTAVRVAFIDQGSIAKSSGAAATVKSNVIATKTNSASDVKILEPNSKVHSGYATTYLSAVTTAATDYYGVKDAGTVATSNIENGFIKAGATDTTTTSKVIVDSTAVTTFDDLTTTIAVLDANSITKITIYVWLEGQDIDCNNDIGSGKVSVKLNFTASDVTNP